MPKEKQKYGEVTELRGSVPDYHKELGLLLHDRGTSLALRRHTSAFFRAPFAQSNQLMNKYSSHIQRMAW